LQVLVADLVAARMAASGVNLPQAQLLPVQPARGGPAVGFHPVCAPWPRCASGAVP
jgi:hypothetical protein